LVHRIPLLTILFFFFLDKHSDKRTYLTCEDYVSQNIPTLIRHSSFLQASPNILEVTLKQDLGNFPSEEKLFESLIRWATYEENISPSLYDDNSDQASTESFENLTTVDLQENPTFPDPATFELDFSILRNPVFSKPTSPIMLRSDEDGVIRRHSIGTVGQRKRQQEKLATKRRDSENSDSFPSFRLMLLPYLLQHIRFPLISPQYLTSNVITNVTVMNAEGMKDLVSKEWLWRYKFDRT
jgi:BTB And C-terminal Kelch